MTPAKPRQRGSEMSEEKLSVRLEAAADTCYDLRDLHGRADLLREAAQLARRVEEAQVCELISIRPAPLPGLLPVYQMSPLDGLGWPSTCGQRVRLVRVE